MMKNLVPVTKLIGTFAFSFWALVMHTTLPLVILVVIELILLGLCGSQMENGFLLKQTSMCNKFCSA